MTDPHSCASCGADHDHHDGAAYARRRRRTLLWFTGLRAAIVVVLAAAVLIIGPPGGLALAIGYGIAVWIVATVAGVVGALALANRLGQAAAAMLGALITAAVAPALLALSVLWSAAPSPTHATAVGLGFLAAAFTAETSRGLQVRALLGSETRAGEVARESAAMTPHQDRDGYELAGTLTIAALIGAYTYLLHVLPVLLIVLLPLNVAVVAYLRRRVIRADRAHHHRAASYSAS